MYASSTNTLGYLRPLSALVLALFLTFPALAQEGASKAKGGDKAEGKPEIKPYAEVITDTMTSDPGLFLVHRDDDKVFFEIPPSELDQDMVWVTQIAGTQAGYSYAGMPVGDRVVRWEKRGDRVLLRDVKYDIRADVNDPIQVAVQATSVAPIIHVFPVLAYGKDQSPVIDATPVFTTEKPEFSAKGNLDVQDLDSKRTFLEQVKSFPTNIETQVLATYTIRREGEFGSSGRRRRAAGPVSRDDSQSGVTVLLHHSMVKLPEEPMKPRVFDERVGFFSVGFNDYGDDSEHEVEEVRYATRWRLEKKNPKKKLSEPVEPIIWYVSREVPAKWQPYVIAGIEAWQPAFEKAGFKNAIIGKLAPTRQEDPDWDPEDARYTTVRWLPSTVTNAFGPHVHDPRTGEILEADIRMYHNILKLVRDWYFVQASPSDPRAQTLPMPDDLIGELLAFVVTHEVGHSLGLPHNMKASSTYTVEQLRDPEFTKQNGTAPSIMDYARFNYVAQPGDGAALLPAVGPYDHFSVEWGYSQFDAGEEEAGLAEIIARQVDNPMFRFGSGNSRVDPSQQTEDLGADAIEATRLGLANIERIADYLVTATGRAGEDYDLLDTMHNALLGQWRREMVHVANVVGGVEQANLFYGDADQRFFPVDAEEQREAVAFLNAHALATPELFLDPDVLYRLGAEGFAERVLGAQSSVLRTLLAEGRITRMGELVATQGASTYAPADFMADVTRGVWSELESDAPAIDLHRRNLQRTHVDLLIDALGDDGTASDRPALARAELADLRERATAKASAAADAVTRGHLDDVAARITQAFERPLLMPAEESNEGNRRRRAGIESTWTCFGEHLE